MKTKLILFVLTCCLLTACSSRAPAGPGEGLSQSSASETQPDAPDDDGDTEEPASTQEDPQALMRQREEMEPWLQQLDPDLYAGIYYDEDAETFVVQTVDLTEFERSPAMEEARERGWVFSLQLVRYSAAQLDEAVTKLWEQREALQISSLGPDPRANSLTISTEDMSEENLERIHTIAGIQGIVYTPGGEIIPADDDEEPAQ